eukprot:CAMPEP_0178795772 /NCGR_PEP_ID=MMETSP0745-20121128/10298_1 /TAXON_ID=913974 /ORGANISM="Nitzschia punctata, Strain CCMP561" /LENGTH=31 /DNA_ID= /DNA_START= /DNA_END= /DNA_ORIENTATION=
MSQNKRDMPGLRIVGAITEHILCHRMGWHVP